MLDTKKTLRKEIKRKLNLLSDEDRVKYTDQIAKQLFSLTEWQEAKVIGITISIPPEIPTFQIIEYAWHEGKEVAVPKCHPEDRTMEFKKITSYQQLESVYSGLLEPSCGTETADVDDIDLIIVPGLGFTREGYRLGFGGGYYDRFLSFYNGKTLSLAFDCQLVDHLPIEMHDVPVQKVVTMGQVFQTFAH